MNSRARAFLVNAALMVSMLAVAFGLCEVVIRLLYKDETVLFPRYHTDYRYGRYAIRGIRPSMEFTHTSVDGSWQFVTNSRGFRNREDFAYDKPAGTLRVLSLGDSQTQGYEVRQDFTYSAALQRLLGHRGKKVEVLNAGVSGFSTAEALALLENEGVKYRPDVVILGFYANDFEDNEKAGLFRIDPAGTLIEAKHEHLPGVRIQNIIYGIPGVRWLSENSYFYSLLFNSVWEYFKARLRDSAVGQHGSAISPATAAEATEYALPRRARFSRNQIELAAALIERMQRFAASKQMRLVVVDVPRVSIGPFSYASSMPEELRKRLTAARVEYVSSESMFEPFDGVMEMHLPHGHRHISEFTHAMIAIEVGRRLSEAGK